MMSRGRLGKRRFFPVPPLSFPLFIAAFVLLSFTFEASGSPYTRKDPSTYDQAWATETRHDDSRSKADCWCDSRPGTRHFWTAMLLRIKNGVEHEESNPHWVHGVCAKAYPYIFKMVTYDENDSFVLNTDCSGRFFLQSVCSAKATTSIFFLKKCSYSFNCQHRLLSCIYVMLPWKNKCHNRKQPFPTSSAGLLSMLVTCARSTALAGQEEPETVSNWGTTDRVVKDEGPAVDDIMQPMDYRTCREFCEANPNCKSLAHGPYGYPTVGVKVTDD